MDLPLDHCRCAQECVAMAQQAEDARDKALWLGLAHAWVRLAEDAARLASAPAMTSDSPDFGTEAMATEAMAMETDAADDRELTVELLDADFIDRLGDDADLETATIAAGETERELELVAVH